MPHYVHMVLVTVYDLGETSRRPGLSCRVGKIKTGNTPRAGPHTTPTDVYIHMYIRTRPENGPTHEL